MSKVTDIIAENIIKSLEQGTIPWIKPWSFSGSSVPVNASTKKAYSGSNYFYLKFTPFASNEWATLKQWQAMGERVKYDQFKLATPIVYYGKHEKKTSSQGERNEQSEYSSYLFARFYNVYNRSQLESWTSPTVTDKPTVKPVNESSFKAWFDRTPMSTIRIDHGDQGKAYYSPKLDYISLPKFELFNGESEYYSTLLHEIGHASGHESRLKRKSLAEIAGFASHAYSVEELTAEIYANAQLNLLGLSNDATDRNTVAYCQSWLKAIKNDTTMLLKASREAYKILAFNNNLSMEENAE